MREELDWARRCAGLVAGNYKKAQNTSVYNRSGCEKPVASKIAIDFSLLQVSFSSMSENAQQQQKYC